jgi:hypothetical protein
MYCKVRNWGMGRYTIKMDSMQTNKSSTEEKNGTLQLEIFENRLILKTDYYNKNQI